MSGGRRALIRRFLDRGANNLDKYLNNLHNAYVLADGRSDVITANLEALALAALKLQELTRSMKDSM